MFIDYTKYSNFFETLSNDRVSAYSDIQDKFKCDTLTAKEIYEGYMDYIEALNIANNPNEYVARELLKVYKESVKPSDKINALLALQDTYNKGYLISGDDDKLMIEIVNKVNDL